MGAAEVRCERSLFPNPFPAARRGKVPHSPAKPYLLSMAASCGLASAKSDEIGKEVQEML
jgi:hypothetical protein